MPLIDVFDGRSQLIAYFHMWHTGRPAAEQCEGCTFSTTHINELSYLHSRDVSYANFCEGPYEESSRYRDFMGWTVPWYSVPQDAVDRLVADRYFGILVCYLRDGDKVYETYWTTGRGNEVMAPSYGLLDLTVYGRQEFWEDSPEGWPQRWDSQRWPVPAGRAPDRPMVTDPGRTRRRPRRDVRWPSQAPLSLRSPVVRRLAQRRPSTPTGVRENRGFRTSSMVDIRVGTVQVDRRRGGCDAHETWGSRPGSARWSGG